MNETQIRMQTSVKIICARYYSQEYFHFKGNGSHLQSQYVRLDKDNGTVEPRYKEVGYNKTLL